MADAAAERPEKSRADSSADSSSSSAEEDPEQELEPRTKRQRREPPAEEAGGGEEGEDDDGATSDGETTSGSDDDEEEEDEEEEEHDDPPPPPPEIFRQAAEMYRQRSEFPQAADFLCRVVQMEPDDAASWAWLGYCYLMLDEVDNAYIAYQQALYLDPPLDEPHVWYGLGLLYERNHCDDQAVEYLTQSLKLEASATAFDRRADCAFRLGLVYKRQENFTAAMKCFMDLSAEQASHAYNSTGGPGGGGGGGGQNANMEQLQAKFRHDQTVLASLRASDGYTTAHAATEGEISVTTTRIAGLRSLSELWFQIGHTHELQGHYQEAKEAYTTVLTYDPTHAKVLQKLGWLYYHAPAIAAGISAAAPGAAAAAASSPGDASATAQQDQTATAYLERSVASDASDHQAWYLLGKCCTRQKQYQKAFRAYEQAVLLNDREPVYWCSLGILYYHNSQYHEALDTYARALQLAPELSETW